MSTTLNLLLNNYTVSVTTVSESSAESVNQLLGSLQNLTNPREIVSIIESTAGVEQTVVKNPQTEEIVLSSGLLSPEE
jgi:hypothetical protein